MEIPVEINKDEHPKTQNRDWRLLGIATTAKPIPLPGGRVFAAGSVVEPYGTVRLGGDLCTIMVPSAPALFLSAAFRFAKLSREILAEKVLPNRTQTGNVSRVRNEVEGEFFECLENLIACLTFSYTAIEAFANEMIPEGYKYTSPRQDGKSTEVYDKAQAERWLKLETKLGKLLPEIRSVPSPKGTAVWQDYQWLEKIRDRLIHLKSCDLQSSGFDRINDYVWAFLLDVKVPNAPTFAKNMMVHFFPAGAPRWLAKCPAV